MTGEMMLFLAFGLMAATSSVMVVLMRNPLHSALWLIVALVSTAVIFVLLHAHFLAAVQILLYAGAIMVLFIFVIMLIHQGEKTIATGAFDYLTKYREPAFVAALAVFGVLVGVFFSVEFFASSTAENFGTVKDVGRAFLYDYFWVFETTSVLLLVAIIGAVVVTRFEKHGHTPGGSTGSESGLPTDGGAS